MFAIYGFKAGAAAANVLSDIVALLTGTTDVATLSAACNKPASSIFTTYAPAGWTMYDAAAATNRVVLHSMCADGVTDKFLIIETDSSGNLKFGAAETWDLGTHTGTNYSGGTLLNLSIATSFNSSAGFFYLQASARGIFFSNKNTGNILGCYSPIIEWERDAAIMDISHGYPCWAGPASSSNFSNSMSYSCPRRKHFTNSGDVTGSAAAVMLTRLGTVSSGQSVGYNVAARSTAEVPYYDVASFFVATWAGSIGGYPIAYCGKIQAEIFGLFDGVDLDELLVDGKTFIRIGSVTNLPRLWVLKG